MESTMRSTTFNRSAERALYRPSITIDAAPKCDKPNIQIARPLAQGFGYAIMGKPNCCVPIFGLLFGIRPTAISSFIVAVVVNSIDRMVF